MKNITVLVLALVTSGCISATLSPDRRMEAGLAPFAALPQDARGVAERATLCAHFAGEIAGDGGNRDQEVYGRMAELRCETIEQELSAVRAKYARNPPVLEALAPLGGW